MLQKAYPRLHPRAFISHALFILLACPFGCRTSFFITARGDIDENQRMGRIKIHQSRRQAREQCEGEHSDGLRSLPVDLVPIS